MNGSQTELMAFKKLEIIHLESEQLEAAWKITDNFKFDDGKLQTYFQALGLVAFEEWLNKREPNLLIDKKQVSLLHPECSQVINAIFNLQVGEFKVCLIPTLSFSDELIDIPQEVINIPAFAAHFYILVGVEDELEVAAIRGFARYDKLKNVTSKKSVLSDGNYEVSLANFHQQTDDLLLYLQCLSPLDIPLPTISDNHNDYLQDAIKIFTQKAVNTGLWIQNQLDEVAEELSWKLLPAPSPLRKYQPTDGEYLDSILGEIDIEIPKRAARSYRDMTLAETKLRLYVLTWFLPETDGDWSLLVILGGIPGSSPPLGVKLRISDSTKVLDEEILEADSNSDNLYTQIVGAKQEKFLVTVTSADGKVEISNLFEFRTE